MVLRENAVWTREDIDRLSAAAGCCLSCPFLPLILHLQRPLQQSDCLKTTRNRS